MKNLWAPWRMAYILKPKKHDGCVFCMPPTAESEEQEIERLVVYRGEKLYVMLNRYPYAAGHLMVLPCAMAPKDSSYDGLSSRTLRLVMQHVAEASV